MAEGFLEAFSTGVVQALFKGGDASEFDNYRGITIVPILAKLFVIATLALGSRLKQGGCKVAGQEGSPRVMPHALESGRKCEGIDPHTLKGTPILEI